LDFDTYLAQRSAFGRPWLHTAAHLTGGQDHKRRRISAGQKA
jgi:hypothetical protein